MNIYNSYWSVYKKIVDSANIRTDEKRFIEKCVYNKYGDKANLDLLIELGCGDGRVSSGFDTIANFKKIILVDATDSIYIAKSRVSDFALEVLCIKTDEPFAYKYESGANILVCSGLVNYFNNQEEAIFKLLKISPELIFISVTGYGFLGVAYKLLNSIRVNFLHTLLMSSLSLIDRKIKYNLENILLKKLIIGLLRVIEPLVSPKIYWLKRCEYEFLFVSNGYQIVDSGSFGFSDWYCLRRN